MPDSGGLSIRQQQMLDMIRDFTLENGYPPTIRQIGEAVKISSTSVVSYNLNVLQSKGYLTRDREVSRGLRLAEEFDLQPEESTPLAAIAEVPILGYIAAGEPFPVPESDFAMDDYDKIVVPSDMVRGTAPVYALRVRGTSMIDALVDDGDIVILQYQQTAQNGEMVAAFIKDEKAITLKRIYWEKNRMQIRLQPANVLMQPIYVHPGNLEIQGKVVGVIRHLA